MTRALCRHCGKCQATRPRGTCWRCYYTPGVKERYAVAKFGRTLTESVVWNIIRDLGRMSTLEVATRYGVSRQTVHNIDRGEAWRHVLERYEAEQDAMTEADLNALIAAQRPTMPGLSEWEVSQEDHGEPIPAAVARGRMERANRDCRVYRRPRKAA